MKANIVALRFIEAVRPLAEDLKPPFRKKLSNYLVSDICKISSVCIISDGNISPKELALLMLVLASIKVFIGDDHCGPFSLPAQLNKFLNEWSSMDSNLRKDILIKLRNSLSVEIAKCFDKNEDLDFDTPVAVKRLDERYDSEYYDGIAATLYRYARVLVAADETISPGEEKILQNIWKKLFDTEKQAGPENDDIKPGEELEEKDSEETLGEVIAELDSLIGLDNIKKEVHTLVKFLEVQQERMRRGLTETKLSLHSVFYGPPGTGKTTVARLLSKIFHKMGFLEKGHLVETDRAGMVGAYVGHTSEKVDKIVMEALGGVLFIDEAYALKPEGTTGNDFGQEAIDILIKRMEDHRENLVIIAAGYPDEMKRFIESNPGLKSRVNRYFYFDHYKPSELLEIFKTFCTRAHYKLTAGAEKKLLKLLKYFYAKRDRSFGNGRLSRNLFEKIIERQATRLSDCTKLSDEEIISIIKEDIPGKFSDDEKKDEGVKTSRLPEWMRRRKKH